MKDSSRNAIREVLAPTMYERMLGTSDGRAYCYDCTREMVKILISEIREGYCKAYHAIPMEIVESYIVCESCGAQISEYEDLCGPCDRA